MTLLDPLFQKLGVNPSEIAGASFVGEIPIAETVINRLIEQKLAQNAHIASLRVAAQDGDQMLVRVEPRVRLLPSLNAIVRIERQPDLPRDPTLLLRWSLPAAGALAKLAATFLGSFKSLPPGIQLNGDVVVVDLRAVLRARGLEELLDVTRRAAVHTRPGVVLVQIEAGLPPR